MSGGWGAYSVRHCQCIGSFKGAERYFKNTLPVRRSKRWKINERPLYKTRHAQFKIAEYKAAQGAAEDYYDLLLYNTPVVRYYKPNALGEEVVLLRNTKERTTWMFLDVHGWGTWYRKQNGVSAAGEEREVYVPLSTRANSPYKDVPEGWSARLVFKDERLLLNKSRHKPVGTAVSTKEDRERRKQLLEKLDTLIELMVIRIPSFHEARDLDYRKGRPFAQVRGQEKVDRSEVGWRLQRGEIDESLVQYLVPTCQYTYDAALSRREYKKGNLGYHGVPSTCDPMPSEEFRRALKSLFVRLAGFDTARGMKELPQFPAELPRNWYSL